MDKIEFTQEYSFVPLLTFAMVRFFTRPIILLLYLFWVVFFVYEFGFHPGESFSGLPARALIYGIVFLLFLPINVYSSTRNLFQTHYLFQGPATYQADDEKLHIKGDGYEISLEWDLMYMVKEYRHWLIIYPERSAAYYIDKSQVNASDFQILKAIIRGQEDLSTKLKKD